MTADSLSAVPADQITAIAELWRREGRTIVASFGGISMLPTIAPGTPLRVRCGDVVSPGDVVLLVRAGEIVVHRLLTRRGRWLLTRGDANAVPDRPAPSGALIGRVISMDRNGTAADIPAWRDTPEQRRFRTIVSALLHVSASAASLAIPLLWQSRQASDTWRRVGAAGVAARLWSRSGGLIVNLDVVLTLRLPTGGAFTPIVAFRYERVASDSPLFAGACRVLNVDAKTRTTQEAYVAIAADGSVAACSFNDRPGGPLAHQRGVAVDNRFRGRGLGTSVLLFQAHALAASGATEIEYHVGLTNRASRRMFAAIGARRIERWIIVTLLRRFRFSKRLAAADAPPPSPS